MTRCYATMMLRDRSGAGAAEFALVLPLLIFLLFGIIDAGRFLWEFNRAEKATQMGARYAIVTDVIPTELKDEDYVGEDYCVDSGGNAIACTPGDRISDLAALGQLTCTEDECTCAQDANCPSGAAIPPTSFANLVQRMQRMKPDIESENVRVLFRGSGIGLAGDPAGMEVVPLVTVELTGMTFKPIMLFNAVRVNLPSFATTLSAESSSGTQSN